MIRKKEEENYIPKAFRKTEKQKVENKEQKGKKIAKKKFCKKNIKKIIIFLCLIVAIIIGITLGISAHRWKTLAKEMLENKNSIVVDIDGNEIARLGCERKNQAISLTDMPNNLKNAYVSIEDERFYSHCGIDIKRTGRGYCFLYFSFWEIFLWWKYHYTTTSKKFNG